VNQMSDKDFICIVLDLYARADLHDELWWRTDGQYAPVTFFAMCSDFFDWATADCEPIICSSNKTSTSNETSQI